MKPACHKGIHFPHLYDSCSCKGTMFCYDSFSHFHRGEEKTGFTARNCWNNGASGGTSMAVTECYCAHICVFSDIPAHAGITRMSYNFNARPVYHYMPKNFTTFPTETLDPTGTWNVCTACNCQSFSTGQGWTVLLYSNRIDLNVLKMSCTIGQMSAGLWYH